MPCSSNMADFFLSSLYGHCMSVCPPICLPSFFLDRVSLCNPGCPGTCSRDQASLNSCFFCFGDRITAYPGSLPAPFPLPFAPFPSPPYLFSFPASLPSSPLCSVFSFFLIVSSPCPLAGDAYMVPTALQLQTPRTNVLNVFPPPATQTNLTC